MNFQLLRPLLVILFFLAFSAGCNLMNDDKKATTPNQIEMSIGEIGTHFAQKYPGLVTVNRQPAGLSFYKIAWNSSQKGIVEIKSANHRYSVSDVLSVFGTQDEDDVGAGMLEITLILGISGPHGISHEAARDKIYDLFGTVQKAGWRAASPFGVPRLAGRDMFNYYRTGEEKTTLDPNYKLSLTEWMSIRDLATWEFYADRTFLQINFMRDPAHLNTTKPGFYIVNIVLRSDAEYFKDFVGPENREQWVNLLPSELKDLSSRRGRKEAELSKMGISINRQYIDPPLPAAVTK